MNFDWIPKAINLFTKAPDTFFVALVFGMLIGGLWRKREVDNAKSAVDVTERRLKSFEEKFRESEQILQKKDQEVSSLREENELIRTEVENKRVKYPFFPDKAEYETKLAQYSELKLGQEAVRLTRKMVNELAAAKKRQQNNGFTDTPLYNKWMKEGEKMLVVKTEILKRLKDRISENELDALDVLLDSHYENKICDIESVQVAVEEIHRLGIRIKEIAEYKSETD